LLGKNPIILDERRLDHLAEVDGDPEVSVDLPLLPIVTVQWLPDLGLVSIS
jgi:hypothetical protein